MSKIAWVTGAGGLIGNYLVQLAPKFAPEWRVVGLTRPQLDLTNGRSVEAAFRKDKPDLILHCAALSRSPACEADPAGAHRQNVEVTQTLARLAGDSGFVFFSTDLVFDGKAGNYQETAERKPSSVYGKTKAEAEDSVLKNPRHTVIRTSLNGGTSPSADRGFNEQLQLAWKKRQILRLFTDEFRSPIPAQITARATWEIALQGKCGVYHVAGGERLSRAAIGRLLAARWPELNPRIEEASLHEYVGAARPPDTSLNCTKAEGVLSFALPGLTRWLEENPEESF